MVENNFLDIAYKTNLKDWLNWHWNEDFSVKEMTFKSETTRRYLQMHVLQRIIIQNIKWKSTKKKMNQLELKQTTQET